MDEFWQRQKLKLHYKSFYKQDEKGCILWTGATYASGYGYTNVRWPQGEKTRERIHRFAYMVHFKKHFEEIPKYDGPEGLECSHLCAEKLCINAEHLVFENHETNQQRIHCHNKGDCSRMHQPYCLI